MRSTKTGNRLVAVIRHPRGMTLFELLGVLIVLGIVAAIAIPAISGVISQSEIVADTRTRERVANQAEIYMNAIDIDGDCKIDEHGNVYAVTVEADVVCTPATTAPVSPATVTIETAYLVKKGFLKEVPVLQANNKMYTSVKVAYVLRSGTDAGSWKVVAPTTDIEPIVPPVSPAETAMTVTQLSLGGLRAPVAGETAATQVTLTSDYASGQVSWSPTLDGGKFNADTVYTATVTMIPVRGKTVYGVETDAYTLSEATATHVSHVAHSGVIVAVFAKTDATVTQRTLGGIVVPVTGAQAVTQVTETTQYTGSVSWSPALDDGKFASHTGYVATVTLHPKKGYTMMGVGANTFTTAGGVATHVAHSGVMTVSYGVGMVPASHITHMPVGEEDQIVHVRMKDYVMGTTEVTGALWREVRTWALSNGYLMNEGTNGGSETLPIVRVRWYDVVVWLNAYSERMGLVPVYRDTRGNVLKNAYATSTLDSAVQSDNNGYRLPTANEWEMVARWRGTTPPSEESGSTKHIATTNNGVMYYWTPGNYASGATKDVSDATETQAVGWFSANSEGGAKAVGQKRANALGMYDVNGNLYEWQFSPTGDINRACLGGGWNGDSSFMTVSSAYSLPPRILAADIGFRVARTAR